MRFTQSIAEADRAHRFSHFPDPHTRRYSAAQPLRSPARLRLHAHRADKLRRTLQGAETAPLTTEGSRTDARDVLATPPGAAHSRDFRGTERTTGFGSERTSAPVLWARPPCSTTDSGPASE